MYDPRDPGETWEEYLYRVQDFGRTYAKLYRFEPFEELFGKEIIVPYITAIRLMYTGAIDLVYMVNKKGDWLILRDKTFLMKIANHLIRKKFCPKELRFFNGGKSKE